MDRPERTDVRGGRIERPSRAEKPHGRPVLIFALYYFLPEDIHAGLAGACVLYVLMIYLNQLVIYIYKMT